MEQEVISKRKSYDPSRQVHKKMKQYKTEYTSKDGSKVPMTVFFNPETWPDQNVKP